MSRTLILLIILAAWSLPGAPVSFYAPLSGPAEEPPNTSPGTGTAWVTFDPVAHTMHVSAVFEGLEGLTTASHIHVTGSVNDANLADTVGPVATTTPTFPDFPAGVMQGSYAHHFETLDSSTYNPAFVTAYGSVAAAEAALFDAIMDGRAYFNIHSTVYGGGEIRGFLAPVPEPATVGLAGLALAGLALLRRRRATC